MKATTIQGYATTVETQDHGIREVSVNQGSAFIICFCGWNTPHYPTESDARARFQYHLDECYGKA